jgi:hypothetical protein
MRNLILANAAEIETLHKRIHETLRNRHKTPEQTALWETVCREFHSRYDQLAFPGGYSTARERIVAGDRDAIEAALCFVELRPYFFRSGYMFKELLPKLKRADLSAAERERLNAVLLAYDEWRVKKRAARGI